METIKEAIDILNQGGTLLYPTDTVWGIGCDATQADAVQKIIDIKGRDNSKSFIVLVDSFHMLEKHVKEFPDVCYDLIDLATSPLTIIYDNPTGIASNAIAKDNTLGIRLTRDPICVKLIRGIRNPIISTSANFTQQATPKSFKEINPKLLKAVDFVLEENMEQVSKTPSTIIKIGTDSSVKVIR